MKISKRTPTSSFRAPRQYHSAVGGTLAPRVGRIAKRGSLCEPSSAAWEDARRVPSGLRSQAGFREHALDKRNAYGTYKVGTGRSRKAMFLKPALSHLGSAYASANPASVPVLRSGLKAKAPVRVLVVEDAGEVRDAAADVLTRRGMLVRKVSRPDNLVHNLHRFKPDVVVLDDYFRKSKVGFAELMPSLMERFPGVRYVVTLSGSPSEDATTDPLRWGASDVVLKDTMFRDRTLERSVLNAARG